MNDKTHNERGQITADAATVYENFFVPALFQPCAPHMLQAIEHELKTVQTALDVACGTGIIARNVASNMLEKSQVHAIDINPGMLAVAKGFTRDVQWKQGDAQDLPYPDRYFGIVTCQFGLMFFPNPTLALKEMWRVLNSPGKLAIAVWDTLENNPGYAKLSEQLAELFGDFALNAISAPYSLGEITALRDLLEAANIPMAHIETVKIQARFQSINDWMRTEIYGWTLADQIDDTQFAQLLEAANTKLSHFVMPDGTVQFENAVHIISVVK